MKSPEEIFNRHSWEAIGKISMSKEFCLKAMKEYARHIASLGWDAGHSKGFSEGSDIDQFTNNPTKEQFMDSIFNQ